MDVIVLVAVQFARVVLRAVEQVTQVIDLRKCRMRSQVDLGVARRISRQGLMPHDDAVYLLGSLRPQIVDLDFEVGVFSVKCLNLVKAGYPANRTEIGVVVRSVGDDDPPLSLQR